MTSDFLRYSCQMSLPGHNIKTQEKLQQARVLIIGMGGLGCPAAQYLAGAGIGTIGLADYDTISISNLHRQILYTPAEVGMKKCRVAAGKLLAQNPSLTINAIDIKVNAENVLKLIQPYDIIIDGTDNFETRYLINDACVLSGKPVVYGAIYQFEGQVAVWNTKNENGQQTPNYRDLFPNVDPAQVPNCAEGGVIPTLAGIIGCMQANEVIKYITKTGEILTGKLLLINVQTWQMNIIKLSNETKTNIKSLVPSEEIPSINFSELDKKIHTENYQLIDVRSYEEHRNHNIGGKNIPLTELENNYTICKDKPVIFYCASGKRSDEAVRLIKKLFPGSNVFSLSGGIQHLIEK